MPSWRERINLQYLRKIVGSGFGVEMGPMILSTVIVLGLALGQSQKSVTG
jgi:hypothetical protein